LSYDSDGGGGFAQICATHDRRYYLWGEEEGGMMRKRVRRVMRVMRMMTRVMTRMG